MRNTWLFRRNIRNTYPIGSRIRVTGPFLDDRLNDILYERYLGSLGRVIQHHLAGAFIGWIGVTLDCNINEDYNITWFDPSEIEVYDEDYFC